MFDKGWNKDIFNALYNLIKLGQTSLDNLILKEDAHKTKATEFDECMYNLNASKMRLVLWFCPLIALFDFQHCTF